MTRRVGGTQKKAFFFDIMHRRLKRQRPNPPTLNYYKCFPSNPKCSCQNDKCLKLYCACFAAGVYCSEDCDCATTCANMSTNFEACQRERARQTSSMLDDDVACACKTSKCLKRYCECFKLGKKCGPLCQCVNCGNTYAEEEEEEDILFALMQEEEGEKKKWDQDRLAL